MREMTFSQDGKVKRRLTDNWGCALIIIFVLFGMGSCVVWQTHASKIFTYNVQRASPVSGLNVVYTQKVRGDFDRRIADVDLEFTFYQPGTYLLECWVHCYRAPDKLLNSCKFEITSEKLTKGACVEHARWYVHRLEVIRSFDGELKKGSAAFSNKGSSPGAFNIQGKPM